MRVILMRTDGQDWVMPMALSDSSPRSLHLIDGFNADLSAEEVQHLEARGFTSFPDDRIIRIPPMPQRVRSLGVWPTPECDPAKAGPMRQMADAGVERLLALGYGGAGVHIGSADTGVDSNHPDLVGRLANFKDFVEKTNPTAKDPQGHGTCTTGIAVGSGATVAKFHGVAPQASYSHARVLDADGSGYTSDVIAGVQWLASIGCDIINMSLGSSETSWTPTTAAVQALCDIGITVVVACGNDGPTTHVESPANADGCIAAAANDQNGNHSDFSSIGPATGRNGESLPKPDISAWGESVVMALSSEAAPFGFKIGQYQVADGTSFACPFTSGCAALYREVIGNLVNFKARIAETAYDNQAFTHDQEGPGRIDIHAAIAKELGVIEVPPKGGTPPPVDPPVDPPPVTPPPVTPPSPNGCLLPIVGVVAVLASAAATVLR